MKTKCKRCKATIEYLYRPPHWCKACRPIVQKENRKKWNANYTERAKEAVKPKDMKIPKKYLVRGLK